MAQLSLVETALWPLGPKTADGPIHETTYSFSNDSAGHRERALVRVRAPLGLQPSDEYILWGLLGLTLDRPDPERVLLATPYWCLKQLAMPTGGSQYGQFRDAVERLAMVGYQNSGFYNPITQGHERVTFHFFSTFLPTVGDAGPVDNDRCWRIEWQPTFFDMCTATGGRMLFDLGLYRQLSPAARRLFLKLKDRFWRYSRVHFNVDDLTINGLGFADTVPLKVRKQKLTRSICELLDRGIISLGRGQSQPTDLYIKKGKGTYVVIFYRGPYFRKSTEPATGANTHKAIENDALYEPLKVVGFDDQAVRHILRKYSRGLIQRWLGITETAMHGKPGGFPGFKVSPMAFLLDGLKNNRMPPDWFYAHEKQEGRRKWEAEQAKADAVERQLRSIYQKERNETLKQFVSGPGRQDFQKSVRLYTQLYESQRDPRARELATDAALNRLEKQPEFGFPEFSVWALEREQHGLK